MTEISKFEILFDELALLEKQVMNLSQKNKELSFDNSKLIIRISELEDQLKNLKKENEILINSGTLNLNSKEREEIKQKITELVGKIDNHLRS
ncbi:MAG: hypothetical protein C4539_04810 [Ignavibacteriales bacterium]|nr:MAG: hypothetical protein C4539_04810 [Ignavibacteriales bacterium]